jgi:hypothetical protein
LVTPDALGLVLLPEPPELPPQAATINNNPQAAAVRVYLRADMSSPSHGVTSTVRQAD